MAICADGRCVHVHFSAADAVCLGAPTGSLVSFRPAFGHALMQIDMMHAASHALTLQPRRRVRQRVSEYSAGIDDEQIRHLPALPDTAGCRQFHAAPEASFTFYHLVISLQPFTPSCSISRSYLVDAAMADAARIMA